MSRFNFFDSQMHFLFSNNLNTINLNPSFHYEAIYRFQRKLNKITGDRSTEIWEDVSLRVFLKYQGGNQYFWLPFCWCWPRVKIFEKQGNRLIIHWFLNRRLRHLLLNCMGGWRKFHAGSVYLLLFFDNKKGKLLKAMLTCTFISFDLSS